MKDEENGGRGVEDLRSRTKSSALRAIRVYSSLPGTTEVKVLGKQFFRSATSLGAHHREAHRAKSDADFISKVEGALQEAEESQYWLELLSESGTCKAERLHALAQETDEPIAIFVTIVKKAKGL